MFVTGNASTFVSRFHQFARTSGDLDSYASEAQGLSLELSVQTFVNKEYAKRSLTLLGVNLSTDIFSDVSTTDSLFNEAGQDLLAEDATLLILG